MTGRDVMPPRFMRKDFFDFLPQFTLIISGNNKSSLKTVDATWRRRLHLVPFNRNIPPEEQDPNLKTELEAEAGGILQWCLKDASYGNSTL
jgi:putative DNA primase/helicase